MCNNFFPPSFRDWSEKAAAHWRCHASNRSQLVSNLRYSTVTRRARVAFLGRAGTSGQAQHVQRETGDPPDAQHGASCGAKQHAEPEQSMGGKRRVEDLIDSGDL
jgi:hypothetical protein